MDKFDSRSECNDACKAEQAKLTKLHDEVKRIADELGITSIVFAATVDEIECHEHQPAIIAFGGSHGDIEGLICAVQNKFAAAYFRKAISTLGQMIADRN